MCVTTLVVKPSKNNSTNSTTTQIDSTKITFNNLLDRKEKEYYVLAIKPSLYTTEMNYIEIYNKYINDYAKGENSFKFYIVDLDDGLNKNYFSDKTNITSDLEKLTLSDVVLFKINNSTIEEYYLGSEKITEALSNLNN